MSEITLATSEQDQMRCLKQIILTALFGLCVIACDRDQPAGRSIAYLEHWEPNESATRTESMSSRYCIGPFQTDSEGTWKQKTEKASYVQWCKNVSAEGVPERSLLYISSWICEDVGGKDQTLEGALIEVNGKEWRLVHGLQTLSRAAVTWVDDLVLDTRHKNIGYELLSQPSVAMRVGEEFDLDSRGFVQRILPEKEIGQADDDKRLRLTLSEVSRGRFGEEVHFLLRLDSPLTGRIACASGTFPLGNGSYLSYSGEHRFSLAFPQRHAALSLARHYGLRMENGTYMMKSDLEYATTSEAGGEIPKRLLDMEK